MSNRPPICFPGQFASVVYQTSIINADGSVAKVNAPKRNLILDVGLDMLPTYSWPSAIAYFEIGTGTKPVRRDSGAITLSRAAAVVTASAGFFVSSDVGRIIKFDSGEEMRVTLFTDATHVTVDTSGTIAASPGTVWYVNETTNQTPGKRSATVTSDAGDNVSTFSVDTWSMKRTILFPQETGLVTYREIGWGPTATLGDNLFGRDVMAGGGDTLIAGQQYKVSVTLSVKLSPKDSVAYGDLGTNGFVTAGDAKIESVVAGAGDSCAIGCINTDGSSADNGQQILEPNSAAGVKKIWAVHEDFTLQAITSTSFLPLPTLRTACDLAQQGYTAGNFYRDYVGSIPVNQANGQIYGLIFGKNYRHFSLKFTAPQTKASDHRLDNIRFRLLWGRVLTN